MRIQTDRGHYVVQSGPYARVRHPGYLGLELWALGTPLVLGSRWACIAAALTAAWIVVRTVLEDRTLQRELTGYAEYARRVPYRLIPLVWRAGRSARAMRKPRNSAKNGRMLRTLLTVSVALVLGCAPSLVRTNNVWKYDASSYEISALPDGRIMPDGWVLTNYQRKGEGRLDQAPGESAHLSYVRNDDDGRFELRPVRLSDGKRLPIYVERYVSQMRTHEETLTVRNYWGMPQSTATVEVEHPVQEVAGAPFTGEGLEGYETILEQRRPGEQRPYRVVYLAFIRPVKGFDAVQVRYENSPSAFKHGVDDVRALVRRLRFGDRGFTGTLQSLDRAAPADVPAAGAPVQL